MHNGHRVLYRDFRLVPANVLIKDASFDSAQNTASSSYNPYARPPRNASDSVSDSTQQESIRPNYSAMNADSKLGHPHFAPPPHTERYEIQYMAKWTNRIHVGVQREDRGLTVFRWIL